MSVSATIVSTCQIETQKATQPGPSGAPTIPLVESRCNGATAAVARMVPKIAADMQEVTAIRSQNRLIKRHDAGLTPESHLLSYVVDY